MVCLFRLMYIHNTKSGSLFVANPACQVLVKPRWLDIMQQQNSHIGIYVTYPSYPIGAQRGTGTITHLCGVYHHFTLTNFSNLPDLTSQRKSDKRHSLICMTVTVFMAFRHLFAELDRYYRMQKYKKISEQTRKTPDYFVFR